MLLFEDESGNKLAFKKDHKGQIEYFYYTNPNSLDFVSDARKVHPKPAFADVSDDSVYKTYIDNLHSLDVISAKSGNNFDPLGKMTQGEFMDTRILAHGWIIPDYIRVNKELTKKGIPGFDRDATITRQIAAVMIQNLKQAKPASEIKLKGDTDSWAADGAIWCGKFNGKVFDLNFLTSIICLIFKVRLVTPLGDLLIIVCGKIQTLIG